MLHLVTGGARSGKSSFAESWLITQYQQEKKQSGLFYLATAQAFDEEMRQRIALHQQGREAQGWQLIESPTQVIEQLSGLGNNSFVLLDCLTLWLTNHLLLLNSTASFHEKSEQLSKVTSAFSTALAEQAKRMTIVVVSNEVGLGVVPLGEDNRLFVDHAGWLNQQVAKVAEQVTLVTAGIPMKLKGHK